MMSNKFDMKSMLEELDEVNYTFNDINEALAENTLMTLKLNMQKQLLILRKLFAQWSKLKGQTKSLRVSSRTATSKSKFGTASRVGKANKIVDEILANIASFKKSLGLELFLASMCLRDTKGQLISIKDDLQKYIKPNGEFNLLKSNSMTVKSIKKNPEFMRLYNQHILKLDKIEKFVKLNQESGLDSKSIKLIGTLLRDDNTIKISPKLSTVRQASLSPRVGSTKAMNLSPRSLSPKSVTKRVRR